MKEKENMEKQKHERESKRQERIQKQLELHAALTTKQPKFIKQLLQVYAKADPFVQQCIKKQVKII